MTKIIMVILVISLVVIMIGGIALFKSSYYWRAQFFDMEFNYLKTEIAFFDYTYGGFFKWVKYRGNEHSENKIVRGNASSIPILLYHGVIADTDWTPDEVNIKLIDFRNQLFALKKAGYQTITLQDYEAFMKGEKNLPKRSFLLTFDDGRKDSYYTVDPILKTLGFVAVMNIITGRSLGQGNESGTFHLSKLELEKMLETGRWQIASHGKDDHDYVIIDKDGNRGHFLSNKLWLSIDNRLETNEEFLQRVKKDLSDSKKDIENKLKVKVLAFAYPFGDFGQDSINYPESQEIVIKLARSIYPITFTQAGSSEFPMNFSKDHLFLAKRIGANSRIGSKELISMLENTEDKNIPYVDDFSRNNGWLQGWGSLVLKNNELVLGSSQVDPSAMTFFGGSYLWQDYYAQFTAKVEGGNAFTLAERYRDGNNYVACDYYDNRIVISQKVAGKDMVEMESLWKTNLSSGKPLKVAMSTNGEIASCYLDGQKVISGIIDSKLKYGGLSFKIWETMDSKTKLFVKDLKVNKNL